MPKDSNLLPLWSQQLLRAARAGRSRSKTDDGEVRSEEVLEVGEEAEETRNGGREAVRSGFVCRKWVQVPGYEDTAEFDHLAKRRKGLSPKAGFSNLGLAATEQLRETKVKKVDEEGRVNVYKVLVPQGQTVEGEVAGDEAAAIASASVAAAPGTVVEGVGTVNQDGVVVHTTAANVLLQPTPPRRKPPPPKRKKAKGLGRSHKKVQFIGDGQSFIPAPSLQATPQISIEGASSLEDINSGMQEAIKAERPSEAHTPGAQTPREGEDEGSGGEGSDNEDEEREEGELSEDEPGHGLEQQQQEEEQQQAPEAPHLQPSGPAVAPKRSPRPLDLSNLPYKKIPSPPPATNPPQQRPPSPPRDASSSPELPLSAAAAGQQRSSLSAGPTVPEEPKQGPSEPPSPLPPLPLQREVAGGLNQNDDHAAGEGEVDLFGSLERKLEEQSRPSAAPVEERKV